MHLLFRKRRARFLRIFFWGLLLVLLILAYDGERNIGTDAAHREILKIEKSIYPLIERIDPERTEYDNVDAKIVELKKELRYWEAEWAAIPGGTIIGRRTPGGSAEILTGEADKIDKRIHSVKSKLVSTIIPTMQRGVVRRRSPHIESWQHTPYALEQISDMHALTDAFIKEYGVPHTDYKENQAGIKAAFFLLMAMFVGLFNAFGEAVKWGLVEK